ncbi:MAG: hypothetical protein KGV59_06240 [Tenacibaculum sp.]|nr:hypothetical protein [Tenacibaculum sp.]
MKRDSFVFYKSWLNVIKDLPKDVQLEIYHAIMEYAINGNLVELKPMAKVAFAFIKQDIDRDTEKYISIVERNRENGKKGGRPKTQKTQVVIEKPKKADNDNNNSNNNGDFSNAVLTNPQYLEVTAMQLKTNTDTIKHYLSKFDKHLIQIGEVKQTEREFKQHFTYWLNKQEIKTIVPPKARPRYV